MQKRWENLGAQDSSAIANRSSPSHYMVFGGDAVADGRLGYDTGCADGRTNVPGLRVLLFGTQERGNQLRPPGTRAGSPASRVPAERARDVASGWIDGFLACGRNGLPAIVALGVNNKSDGGADPAEAGAAWAETVERIGARDGAQQVTVTAGIDAEPAWSTPGWVREWMRAFIARSRRALYVVGSADGCPQDASTQASCANGWTLADMHHVATGAGRTVVAVPQIFRTDGIQARQWASISSWGVRNGVGPLRIAGALSQQQACRQRAGCPGTDNSPAAARAQLLQALAADPATRVPVIAATDMAWPKRYPDT